MLEKLQVSYNGIHKDLATTWLLYHRAMFFSKPPSQKGTASRCRRECGRVGKMLATDASCLDSAAAHRRQASSSVLALPLASPGRTRRGTSTDRGRRRKTPEGTRFAMRSARSLYLVLDAQRERWPHRVPKHRRQPVYMSGEVFTQWHCRWWIA